MRTNSDNKWFWSQAIWTCFLLITVTTTLMEATANRDDDVMTLIAHGTLRKACHNRKPNTTKPMTRIDTTLRLHKLRQLMRNEVVLRKGIRLDAYLVPSSDEHQNEFVSEYDRRLTYISGFTGSYGTAIITTTKAILWTDGRYHLQADDQLDCNWLLMREGHQNVPTPSEWLLNEFRSPNSGPPVVLGVDPKLIAQSEWYRLEAEFYRGATTLQLCEVEINLVDYLWLPEGGNRPARRRKDVFVLENQYAGRDWWLKVNDTREELKVLGADAQVVTALDEIAWLLNIRGRDVPFSPFVRSYVILDMFEIRLFIDEVQLRKNKVYNHFNGTGRYQGGRYHVRLVDYEQICVHLQRLSQAYQRVLVPNPGASRFIYQCVPEGKRLSRPSPISALKAVKNQVEIRGMHKAHIRDGVAMCEFFSYFESRFGAGHQFTELEVVKVLNEFRFEQQYSLGNSFRTVVGWGANGAQPHYEPTPNTNTKIWSNSTLVLDSGGQYYDGTTDVSRTVHMGVPSASHRQAYTRVLLGHIQLAQLTFPANMRAAVADILVRAPLWDIGLDYLHATSHGIGSFLAVHEEPITMHYNNGDQSPLLRPGYFLSVEPGYYREGEFGVRLENVLEVIEKPWLQKHYSGNRYLGFKTVTVVPYQMKLIDLSLLSVQHRKWLNAYNERIRVLVGAELKRQNLMSAFYWMMDNTNYIPEYGSAKCVTPNLICCAFVLLCILI